MFCLYLFLLSTLSLSPFALFSLSLSDLTLEEKIGQLLIVHFHGEEANDEARELIQDVHVGGVIYYNWANELKNPQQVQHLSQGLQALAQRSAHPIPLFIAVDQEGGRVNRLKNGFTVFPGHYPLGRTGEWEWGEESARMMAEELKAVGVSLNLSPVVDVASEQANPVIGVRSFSSDPVEVAKWGRCTLNGYQKAGVIATLKHFPGHGDVKVDSHEALPFITKQREELNQVELYPFRFLASQAEAILTAHLFVPALDPDECVTFSKKVITDLLRKELNFQGVIITDSLVMEGVLSQSSTLEDAALKSLLAGHDLILLGGKQLIGSQNGLECRIEDVKRIHRFLVDATQRGLLSEERIHASVSRILALKEKYGLFKFTPLFPSVLDEKLKIKTHCALAERIALRSLDLIKGKKNIPIHLDRSSYFIVAPESLREELTQTDWGLSIPSDQIIYFKGLNPDSETNQEIIKRIKKGEAHCLYFSSNIWQFPGQQELFFMLRRDALSVIAIATRDPLDARFLDEADGVLCTFSATAFSLQAAYDFLTRFTPK
ncbi:MAG: beta-N-acetylhexosaminidase [Parachlamydiaceae bacterium]